MENSQKLKEIVREKYSKIAEQDKLQNASSCCGATNSSEEVYNIMQDDYSSIKGYEEVGDLGLGCGLPTQFAKISHGDTVLDLGSGAGNDCFIARHETGEKGKVIGIDFTENMINRARKNAISLGFNNVEFRYGDIENMPVSDSEANVVVSNCVLNLVPNKQQVFKEIFRVLQPGGHFSISDIVLEGELPEALRRDAEMYAGCVAGAIQQTEYLKFIEESGFENIQIQKKKKIVIPDDILGKYLDADQLESIKQGKTGIFSITVFATKPGQNQKPESKSQKQQEVCCPGTGCCD